MEPSNDPQNIEELRQRFETLKTKKITAEANVKTSTETLEKLKKKALDEYGTDDLDALRAMLEAMKQENERKRAEYQKHLTEIETKLAEVEIQHAKAADAEHRYRPRGQCERPLLRNGS